MAEKTCSVDGCDKSVLARDWCSKHYQRWKSHGDPSVMLRKENRAGTINSSGHVVLDLGGRGTVFEHVWIAENAIGKRLPKGAEVHHADLNPGNNEPTNLVICPSRSYHRLLHTRTEAMLACGNANARKCWICKQWADIGIQFYGKKRQAAHRECVNARFRRIYAEKREQNG